MAFFYPALFFLGSTLGTHLTPLPTVTSAAEDITAVVESEPPLFDGDDEAEARVKTAKLLMVWCWRESQWNNTIGIPEGYGPGMVAYLWFGVPAIDMTKARMLTHRREGFRLALRVMLYLKNHCKGLRSGLGAYAGRQCGDQQGLVNWRLHLASEL
jgi:hypothetical protein